CGKGRTNVPPGADVPDVLARGITGLLLRAMRLWPRGGTNRPTQPAGVALAICPTGARGPGRGMVTPPAPREPAGGPGRAAAGPGGEVQRQRPSPATGPTGGVAHGAAAGNLRRRPRPPQPRSPAAPAPHTATHAP